MLIQTTTTPPFMRTSRSALLTAALLSGSALTFVSGIAHADPVSTPNVVAELISEQETIRPGDTFTVAIALRPSEGWHTYWQNPGSSGLPTKVRWEFPAGFQVGELQWPHPVRLGAPPFVTYGYEKDAVLLADVDAPANLRAGEQVDLVASAQWLTCRDDACIPGKAELPLKLNVESTQPLRDSRWDKVFDDARARLPQSLEGWTATVDATNDTVRINVAAPHAVRPSTVGIQVFPLVGNMIDASGETTVHATDSGFRLETSAGDEVADLAEALRLVLVAEGGWDADGNVHALQIDARVASNTATAPANDVAASSAEAPGERATNRAAAADESVNSRDGSSAAASPGATAATPSGQPALGTANPSGQSALGAAGPPGAVPVTLGVALVLAFLGGLILNLMPCVFPVLSLKILGFVHVAHHQPVIVRRHGYAFATGVMLSFWMLAGLLIALRAGGQALGWGFQLQEPLFVAGIAALLLAMSLNLLGVFEFGSSVAGAVGRLDSQSGYKGSFASGVLATVLATPCSGPFMGTALGFALAQPAVDSLLVFTALGAGMSAPYLVLACVPALLARLPRPGAWMERFRRAMAVPLLATVVWLVWVFRQQTSDDGLLRLLGALALVTAAAWIVGRHPATMSLKRARAWSVLFLLGAAGLAASVPASTQNLTDYSVETADGVSWLAWSPEAVAEQRSDGRVVFVDFTADWCLSCKVNERIALVGKEFAETLRTHEAVAMKADWTRADPRITEALASFDRSGVPLYVVYPRDQAAEPIVLPQVLTPGIVRDALARAAT